MSRPSFSPVFVLFRASLCALSALPVASSAADASPATIDWVADATFLRERLPGLHPNLYHTLGAEAFARKLDAFIADRRSSEAERVLQLAQIVAAIGEGHTRLTLPLAPQARLFPTHAPTEPANVTQFTQFPLRLESTSDGYVVAAATDQMKVALGSVLVAIDARPVDDVVKRLGSLVHHDNAAQRRYLMASFLVVPEILHARGITGAVDRATWTFRDRRGKRLSLPIQALPSSQELNWNNLPNSSNALRNRNTDRDIWFENFPAADAIYVRLRQIADDRSSGERFSDFSNRLLTAINHGPQQRLIIDLRGNSGGNSSLVWPLVTGLVRSEKLTRPGALYVIVDGGTFSAAVDLVADLEKATPAIIVGERTGGSPNSYGDSRRLQLPSSGLTVRVSTRYTQGSHGEDRRNTVKPQIDAPLTQTDFLDGSDSALAAIVQRSSMIALPNGRWRGTVAFRYLDAQVDARIQDGGSGLAGWITMPEVGVAETQLDGLHFADTWLHAELKLERSTSRIELLQAREHLTGWIEYQGRPYPMVLYRVNADASD
ncbi:hypothetical protein C7S18_21310 [Ahniella affigens]|uniref:Tail specific protease domain-containing protein n=1 Tax=Ahniella affigens TaxID=2021234 RepID=A0A2P1PXL9_9GAMM|nr:S41 family peptidase [Ahniella affigens]AVP99554.1 hypothetical protein C7S18_21310 [Ahniella affigens]